MSEPKDLFGHPIATAHDELSTAKRKPTPKRGHYRPVGTGPKGETCKTCRHLVRRHWSKTYLKCGRARNIWTNGPGSDVRARDAACEGWEKIAEDQQ